MKSEEIKPKKWENTTISQYRQIMEILKDVTTDDITKDVELISLLFGVDEKEVWDMPVDEVGQYKKAMEFLTTPPSNNPKKVDKVYINDRPYKVCVDLSNFTYAQYVDFQQYWTREDNLTDILSVLLVPEGVKYGSGYDIKELKKEIDENISMSTATSLCAFFLRSLVELLEHSLRYLEKKTKMSKNLPIRKTQKEREAIEKAMKEVKVIKGMIPQLKTQSIHG